MFSEMKHWLFSDKADYAPRAGGAVGGFDAAGDLRTPCGDVEQERARGRELARLLALHVAAMHEAGFHAEVEGMCVSVRPDGMLEEDPAMNPP